MNLNSWHNTELAPEERAQLLDGAVLLHGAPLLPKGGGPMPDLVQPGWVGILQKQTVRFLCVSVVRQGEQDVGRCGEAGVEVDAVFLDQRPQPAAL